VAQPGSPATQSGRDEGGGRRAVRGSRLTRRRRVLLGVGIAAALLAVGGLIGASFVKSPQQLAADTAAPPPVLTVPVAAIVTTASGASYVTVVGAHSKQAEVPVTPGLSENGYVQVTPVHSGALSAGDRVVVSGS
jgi:HlyD family secretion protein